MEHPNIRQELHQFVDTGDDKLLKMMYAVAKEYTEADLEYSFTTEEIAVFEERRNKRLSGENKPLTWAEAKTIITGKRL